MSKKKKKSKTPARKAPKPAASAPSVGLDAAKKAARARGRNTSTQIDPTKIDKEITMTKQSFEKTAAEAAGLNKDQVEALVQSGTVLLKGTEDIVKTYVSIAQESVEKNTAAVKTLLACKTLNELTETQNKLAQESFEGFVAHATKLSELSIKIAKETLEPINTQVAKTIKKATDSAAA